MDGMVDVPWEMHVKMKRNVCLQVICKVKDVGSF